MLVGVEARVTGRILSSHRDIASPTTLLSTPCMQFRALSRCVTKDPDRGIEQTHAGDLSRHLCHRRSGLASATLRLYHEQGCEISKQI